MSTLLQPSPAFTATDHTDRRFTDVEFSRHLDSRAWVNANCTNLVICQFTVKSSALISVSYIVCLCSDQQMIYENTRCVVTSMTYDEACRAWSVMMLPHYAMGIDGTAIRSDTAVPLLISSTYKHKAVTIDSTTTHHALVEGQRLSHKASFYPEEAS